MVKDKPRGRLRSNSLEGRTLALPIINLLIYGLEYDTTSYIADESITEYYKLLKLIFILTFKQLFKIKKSKWIFSRKIEKLRGKLGQIQKIFHLS